MLPDLFGSDFDNQTIFIIIAVIAFLGITMYRFKKIKVEENTITRLLVVCMIAGLCMFLFSRFFDDLWHNIDEGFFKNLSNNIKELGFIEALKTWKTFGITFLGGFYGAFGGFVIAYWFILKSERHKLFYYFDNIVIGLALAHSIGRLSCFVAGCCYGIEAPAPWGIYFPYGDSNTTVLPTNLYESIFLLGFFFILLFVIKKNHTRYYMVTYGVFRFLIEFLRGDSRGASPISWLSPSQFLSIIMIIVGVCLFIWGDKLNAYIERRWTRPKKEKA